MLRSRRRSIPLAAAALLAACTSEPTTAVRVPNAWMEATLAEGAEVAVVPRRPGRGGAVTHGDILLFRFPDDSSKQFVLRLAGLPGDTLEMRGAHLHRNGRRVEEPYAIRGEPGGRPGEDFRWQGNFAPDSVAAAAARQASRDDWGPLVVPPDGYFLLGDNRAGSLDSRYWGFASDSDIVGRVVAPR